MDDMKITESHIYNPDDEIVNNDFDNEEKFNSVSS
jgi:hypothetical protein